MKCEIKVDRMEKNKSERGVHGYERIEKKRKEMKRQGVVNVWLLVVFM